MKPETLIFAVVTSLALTGACGKTPQKKLAITGSKAGSGSSQDKGGTSGSAKDGGAPPDGGDASTMDGGDGDGGMLPMAKDEGPVIVFTAPDPSSDPNDDVVLTDRTVSVRCNVTRAPEPLAADVDKTSVKITTINSADANPVVPPVTALGDGNYEAVFDLSEFPNGRLTFTCQAKDLAKPQHVTTAKLETLLDLGPEISILTPKEGAILQLTGSSGIPANDIVVHDITFRVNPVLLTPIPAVPSPADPTLYTGQVDFNDKAIFGVAPVSAEILVRATDARTPTAVPRESRRMVTIDSQAPTIVITAPKDGSIEHGLVTLTVMITDASGVQPGSVVADINYGSKMLNEWTVVGNVYRATFDTLEFTNQSTVITQLTNGGVQCKTCGIN